MSDAHKKTKDIRREKLEAALKENLHRRKAQTRARIAQEKGDRSEGATEGSDSGRDLA
jgi:hypothetical protein